MAVTKLSTKNDEAMFVKEIPMPSIKQHFTIKQLDERIQSLQNQIEELEKDKADALAIKEEPKEEEVK